LGSLNTRAGVPDGNYELRVTATDQCGTSASLTRTITVDNTPPTATISAPLSCANVDGVVQINGTASDAHLAGWTLQYTGDAAHGWVTIASGNASIAGVLANWDTSALAECAYTLRLVVTDTAVLDCNSALRNQTEYYVSVNVGPDGPALRGDIDCDGVVDLADINPFVYCLTHGGVCEPCP
jgi:hypothetical protein